jgi:hypothetical protein
LKIPAGMSKKVTHRLSIADRSEAGMKQAANILEMFLGIKELEDRTAIWRASTDQFFIFVVAANSGSIGAVRAKDLQHLLRTIEELFDTHLLPPANPAFDIFVEAPDGKTVHEHIKRRLLATVALLERGIRP